MVNFTRLAATAKRLIEANGRDVTLYRQERDPADGAKPWRGVPASTAPEATMGPIKMVFVPPDGSGFGDVLADDQGQLTKRITKIGLMAADSIAALSPAPAILDPRRYDHLVDGSGHALKIVRVAELKPGDTSLIYAIGLDD